MQEPPEASAAQVEEEEWWVAEWCEEPPHVGYDGDEEENGVYFVLALTICADDGANQEHGCACGSHK